MSRLPVILILLLAPAVQAGPENSVYAVVRLDSHGGSGTVISTEPGRTLILTCAHAFTGNDSRGVPLRDKPIVLSVPSPTPGPAAKAKTMLLKIDTYTDLALLQLDAGPLAFVAPVGMPGPIRKSCWSVGYDERNGDRSLPTWRATTIRTMIGTTTYTVDPPWHGRSGGALIDSSTGEIIGVVSGYISYPAGPGVYASLTAIRNFLAKGGVTPQAQQQPQQSAGPLFTPPGQIRSLPPRPSSPVPQSPQWPSPYGRPEQGQPYCPDGKCPLPR